MAEQNLSVRTIIDEFVALGREHSGYLALVTAAITAGYIALDLVGNGAGTSISGLVVGIFVQFLVVERLLADRLPGGKATTRRYGAMFSSSLLSNIAVIVSLIVFIVPGLILLAAWSASTPFIVVEDMSGPKALRASWEATEGSRTPLTLVVTIGFAIIVAALALLFTGLYFLEGSAALAESDELRLAEIIPSNIIASAVSVVGWLFGAAVYRLLRPVGGEIEEVFA
jgi:hypothetical protein